MRAKDNHHDPGVPSISTTFSLAYVYGRKRLYSQIANRGNPTGNPIAHYYIKNLIPEQTNEGFPLLHMVQVHACLRTSALVN